MTSGNTLACYCPSKMPTDPYWTVIEYSNPYPGITHMFVILKGITFVWTTGRDKRHGIQQKQHTDTRRHKTSRNTGIHIKTLYFSISIWQKKKRKITGNKTNKPIASDKLRNKCNFNFLSSPLLLLFSFHFNSFDNNALLTWLNILSDICVKMRNDTEKKKTN